MNLKIIFLVVCWLWVFTPIRASDKHYDSLISFCPPPTWGTVLEVPAEPLPIRSSQVNQQILLSNRQYHLDEKALFIQSASKVLTKTGVQEFSQIKFYINPSNEHLLLHHIRVCRNGIWSDRMSASTYKVLQRGHRLEQNLYDDRLCVVYFLNDIRVGDVIEYACSIVEEDVLLPPHCADILYLQDVESIERIYHRIVGHPTQLLITKSFPGGIEPTVTTLSPSLQEWVWEALATEDFPDEVDRPIWYDGLARVYTTQYTHWEDVARREYPFYVVSEEDPFFSDQTVESLVHQWQETTRDPHLLVTLALRFVQDEIRYQGMEDGTGAYIPTAPLVVLDRRFGDCKDKTLLLHMFLKCMGIDSMPVFVHSKKGKVLSEALPNPNLFNHVILSISCNEKQYWVDPTITSQGGIFPDIFCPNYHWGLPISHQRTDLIAFPGTDENSIRDVNTEMVVRSPDQIEVTIHTTCKGREADALRDSLDGIGLRRFSEAKIKDMKNSYNSVEILSSLAITDDRDANNLSQIEHYLVPTRGSSEEKTVDIHSRILRHLDRGIELGRVTPYELRYPLRLKESITIRNPLGHWEEESDEMQINNPSLFYSYFYRKNQDTIRIDRELNHPQDHVPVEQINDYLEAINRIESYDMSEIGLAL